MATPIIQDSRMLTKRSTSTGIVPSIAPSTNHLDGSWVSTDIYKGEFFMNLVDDKFWFRSDNGIIEGMTVKRQQQGTTIYGVATGTNTYAVTLTPAPTAYVAGMMFNINFTNANTGAATLNVNGLGAKSLNKDVSTALVSGDILSGSIYTVVYDGTNFQVSDVESDGGLTMFTQLTDVPSSYSGQALKSVRVNAAATGLEFFTPASAVTGVGQTGYFAYWSSAGVLTYDGLLVSGSTITWDVLNPTLTIGNISTTNMYLNTPGYGNFFTYNGSALILGDDAISTPIYISTADDGITLDGSGITYDTSSGGGYHYFNGQVGIGYATPSNYLSIVTPAAQYALGLRNATYSINEANGFRFWQSNAGIAHIENATKDCIQIDANGKLGYNQAPLGDVLFAIKANGSYNYAFYIEGSGAEHGISVTKAGSVGIGEDAVTCAKLDIASTTKGLLLPRMTGSQAEAISSPVNGLLIYSTNGNGSTITSTGFWGYDGSTWVKLN